MAPRIQFRIDDSQYEALFQETEKQGFPDVVSYVKDLVLTTIEGTNDQSRTSKSSVKFIDLYKQAVDEINKREPGSKFTVRELVPNPPALLGRYIHEAVVKKEGKRRIENVKELYKDVNGAWIYEIMEEKEKDTLDNFEG
ncbi:hypothetical protein D3C74_230940 [compost metagenome]